MRKWVCTGLVGAAVFLWAASVLSGEDPQIKIRVTAASVVRLEPSSEAAVLGEVGRGEIFVEAERTGEWYRIILPANEEGFVLSGYIHQSRVEVIEEAAEEPWPPAKAEISRQAKPVPSRQRTSPSPEVQKKFYLAGSVGMGVGFSKILVGRKSVNDQVSDVNIYPGGGTGLLAGIGYSLSHDLKAEIGIGPLLSGSSFSNGKVIFRRFPLMLSLAYLFPSEKTSRIYATAGPALFLGPAFDLTEGSIERNISYKTPFGFTAGIGARMHTPGKKAFLFGEIKYMGALGYKMSSANFYPVSRLRDMSGHGVFFMMGIGFFL